MGSIRAPRLGQALIRVTAPPEDREAMVGDLAEEYARRRARGHSRTVTRAWYWRQVLRSLPTNLRRRLGPASRGPSRPARGEAPLESLRQDLRLALRGFRRAPAFTAVIVATLALGIGANTVVFSAVHGLVLSPFPFPDPQRLVGVGTGHPRLGQEVGFFENLSPAEYVDIRDGAGTLEDVVAWDMGNRQIAGDGPPENLFSAFWWGNALRTLRMPAHLGRGFTDDEVRQGTPVALLSHRVWSTRFGADSSMVGRAILVSGEPHTLVGVLPPGVLIYGADLWTVMPMGPEAFPRSRRQFQILARVREGVALEAVNAELEGIARRVEAAHVREHEEYAGWRIEARTWADVNVRMLRPAALVLLGAVGFVLLLACVNVGSLVLARSSGRRREVAVRTALGARRFRIVRQLLAESVLLASAGGLVGVGVAVYGVRGVRAFLSGLGVPVPGDVTLDGPVLAFTAAVSLAAGLLFGLVPALHATGGDVHGALKAEGSGATASASRHRLLRVFVGVEVALALVLLAGGGLLVRSLARLNAVDPGFETRNVLTMRLTLPWQKYDQEGIAVFFAELTDRVAAIPGVRSVAVATQFPPRTFLRNQVWIQDRPVDGDATLPRPLTTVVSPGYFETLGLPLLQGKPLTALDRDDAPRVAVINEAAAARLFPGQEPLGRRVSLGPPDSGAPWFEVVGVVASARNRGLDRAPEPELFATQAQAGGGNQLFLLVRTEVEPRSVLGPVRTEVQALDPEQPVYAVQTVEEAFAAAAAPRRATTLFLALFAAFGLVLAAVGIHGVVARSTSERTREIGLRLALGADAGRVRRLVVRQTLLPVILGMAAGLAGASALGRALSRLLFEVRPADPPTLAAVALLLGLVALVATYVPARRASRMDPLRALGGS